MAVKPDVDLGQRLTTELDRVPVPSSAFGEPRYRHSRRPRLVRNGTRAAGLVAAGCMALAFTVATATGAAQPTVWAGRLSSLVQESGGWLPSSPGAEPAPAAADQPPTPSPVGDPGPSRVIPVAGAAQNQSPKPGESGSEKERNQEGRKSPSPSPSPSHDAEPGKPTPTPQGTPRPQPSHSPSPLPSPEPSATPE